MNPKTEREPILERTRNKLSKIDQIKKSTKKLIKQRGFFETTNHGIAHDANVSVGLLYKYFPRGKIDVIRAVIEEDSKTYEQMEYEELIGITPQNYIAKLRELILMYYHAHVSNKTYIRAMEIAMLSNPELFADLRGLTQELLTMVPVIEKLQDFGLLNTPMTREMILVNTNVLDQITHQYLFFHISPFQSDEEFFDFLVDLCMKIFEVKKSNPI